MNRGTPGIVLAGGRSSRMGGREKSLLPLGETTLLGCVLDRLRPQVTRVAISANGDSARFANFEAIVLPDKVAGYVGPLAGVLAGLDWAAAAQPNAPIVSVAADTPFFPADLVLRLSDAAADRPGDVAVACCGGRAHPVFALWPAISRGKLRSFLLDGRSYRVRDFLDICDVVTVNFSHDDGVNPNRDPFFNVNTPEDLALARRWVAETSA